MYVYNYMCMIEALSKNTSQKASFPTKNYFHSKNANAVNAACFYVRAVLIGEGGVSNALGKVVPCNIPNKETDSKKKKADETS